MPTDTSELSVPHPPEGPPCGPSGPTLERQEMRYVPGKPPHREAILAVRVRNPLASPVWLLYDVGGRLPSAVNAVSVSRTSPAPGAHVWSFEGDGGFQAVRLPPGADLVLRDLELSSYSTDDPFVLAFATSLTIGDRPAESWAGQAGLSPPSGDFRLTSLVPEFERNVDDTAAEPLAARILCVTRFPAGPGGPRTGAQALTERPIIGQKARLFGLSPTALSERHRLPAFASRQAEYVTFKQEQERIRRLRIAGQQKVPERLRRSSWAGTRVRWSFNQRIDRDEPNVRLAPRAL